MSHNFILCQGEKNNICITWALLKRQMLRLADDKPISRRPLRKVHPRKDRWNFGLAAFLEEGVAVGGDVGGEGRAPVVHDAEAEGG